MSRTAVMHLVDALRIGGAERVAINLANLLPQDRYKTYLCSTREEGPLAHLVESHVGRLSLTRASTLDPTAVRAMVKFIREKKIRILHAHASALFFARLVSLFAPYLRLIWHDHYGRYAFNDRPVWLYKLATLGIAGVVAVNRPLEAWSLNSLGVKRVWYIPNLVQLENGASLQTPSPGNAGQRLVCVANIRPQKDHFNLLEAMRLVKARRPFAHLLLVGDYADKPYCDSVLQHISTLGLSEQVTYLGARQDIGAILRNTDIGVLSSGSEGLPLALLEYGIAGLPAVSTNVGQCPEVLNDGAAGLLVPPSSP
jgi:glycosyltransferase involved in cell wall biosynthesis